MDPAHLGTQDFAPTDDVFIMDTKTIFTLSSFAHGTGHSTVVLTNAWFAVEALWDASVGAARDEDEIINELGVELSLNLDADIERDAKTIIVARLAQNSSFEWYCQGLECSFCITRHEV